MPMDKRPRVSQSTCRAPLCPRCLIALPVNSPEGRPAADAHMQKTLPREASLPVWAEANIHALCGHLDEGLRSTRQLSASTGCEGRPLPWCCPQDGRQSCAREGDKALACRQCPCAHPPLEARTVSAQGARECCLLREASVLLPELAHLCILPGRCSTQLFDFRHLHTTCGSEVRLRASA